MELIWILIVTGILVLIFLSLWLREKRRAQIEYIAYGLRENDKSDENSKTNITQMAAGFVEAITKLEELGEVKQDNWGQWIWIKSGEPVGHSEGLG
jgi:hypothetical protein